MKDTRKIIAFSLVVVVALAALSVMTKVRESRGPKFESVEHVLSLARQSEEEGDKNIAYAILKSGARQYRGNEDIEAAIYAMKLSRHHENESKEPEATN